MPTKRDPDQPAQEPIAIETKPLCFVISPIGPIGSPTRRRADGVLSEIIRAALEDRYDVRRADDYGEPGLFTEKIVDAIRSAELCIADLSDANPNVMYELALRHVVQKPVIQLIEEGQPIPSDVAGVDTVTFQSDLAGRSAAVAKLRTFAEQIGKRDFGNPIVRAIQAAALDRITTGTSNVQSVILASVQSIASRLGLIEDQIRSAPSMFSPHPLSAAAMVSVAGIRDANGELVTTSKMVGEITIELDVTIPAPGAVQRVETLLDGNVMASQTLEAVAAGRLRMKHPLRTDAYNAVNDVATFPNGPHLLAARLVSPSGAVYYSPPVPLVFANPGRRYGPPADR